MYLSSLITESESNSALQLSSHIHQLPTQVFAVDRGTLIRVMYGLTNDFDLLLQEVGGYFSNKGSEELLQTFDNAVNGLLSPDNINASMLCVLPSGWVNTGEGGFFIGKGDIFAKFNRMLEISRIYAVLSLIADELTHSTEMVRVTYSRKDESFLIDNNLNGSAVGSLNTVECTGLSHTLVYEVLVRNFPLVSENNVELDNPKYYALDLSRFFTILPYLTSPLGVDMLNSNSPADMSNGDSIVKTESELRNLLLYQNGFTCEDIFALNIPKSALDTMIAKDGLEALYECLYALHQSGQITPLSKKNKNVSPLFFLVDKMHSGLCTHIMSERIDVEKSFYDDVKEYYASKNGAKKSSSDLSTHDIVSYIQQFMHTKALETLNELVLSDKTAVDYLSEVTRTKVLSGWLTALTTDREFFLNNDSFWFEGVQGNCIYLSSYKAYTAESLQVLMTDMLRKTSSYLFRETALGNKSVVNVLMPFFATKVIS